jgi:hypothetical protein
MAVQYLDSTIEILGQWSLGGRHDVIYDLQFSKAFDKLRFWLSGIGREAVVRYVHTIPESYSVPCSNTCIVSKDIDHHVSRISSYMSNH